MHTRRRASGEATYRVEAGSRGTRNGRKEAQEDPFGFRRSRRRSLLAGDFVDEVTLLAGWTVRSSRGVRAPPPIDQAIACKQAPTSIHVCLLETKQTDAPGTGLLEDGRTVEDNDFAGFEGRGCEVRFPHGLERAHAETGDVKPPVLSRLDGFHE